MGIIPPDPNWTGATGATGPTGATGATGPAGSVDEAAGLSVVHADSGPTPPVITGADWVEILSVDTGLTDVDWNDRGIFLLSAGVEIMSGPWTAVKLCIAADYLGSNIFHRPVLESGSLDLSIEMGAALYSNFADLGCHFEACLPSQSTIHPVVRWVNAAHDIPQYKLYGKSVDPDDVNILYEAFLGVHPMGIKRIPNP